MGGVHHPDHDVGVGDGGTGNAHHVAAQVVAWPVHARRIDEDGLRGVGGADAEDAAARGLRAG